MQWKMNWHFSKTTRTTNNNNQKNHKKVEKKKKPKPKKIKPNFFNKSLFCQKKKIKNLVIDLCQIAIKEPDMPNRKINCSLCNNCTFSLQFSANAVETNQKFIDECYKKIEKNKNK